MAVLLQSNVPGVPCRRGKVRDVYDLGDRLALVATDRISAFDWVLPTGIPDKGKVLTALTLLEMATGREITQMADSPVHMRNYSDEEIDAYIASGDPFDKAGAYAIQSTSFHPVEEFDHCMANVMGLPLCHVTRMLRAAGESPNEEIARACQGHIGYVCPVYERILAGGE